jgi:histidine triad (HIT) family protein
MADTLFGKIIRREIPADIVYEDDDVLAFRDINPQAPVHVLFIPKRAIATLNDATDRDAELIGKLVLAATAWAKKQGFADDGYRLVMNCNTHGGQTVFHIHVHLLAGRQMTWPPGCKISFLVMQRTRHDDHGR